MWARLYCFCHKTQDANAAGMLSPRGKGSVGDRRRSLFCGQNHIGRLCLRALCFRAFHFYLKSVERLSVFVFTAKRTKRINLSFCPLLLGFHRKTHDERGCPFNQLCSRGCLLERLKGVKICGCQFYLAIFCISGYVTFVIWFLSFKD